MSRWKTVPTCYHRNEGQEENGMYVHSQAHSHVHSRLIPMFIPGSFPCVGGLRLCVSDYPMKVSRNLEIQKSEFLLYYRIPGGVGGTKLEPSSEGLSS